MAVIHIKYFVGLLVAVAGLLAQAQSAPKAEIISLVNMTVDHVVKVGAEKAAADINSQPAWKVKSLNTVMFNLEGRNMASALNPRIVGKSMIEAKDPTGKAFVKAFVDVAKSSAGEGWVEFQFLDPDSQKVEDRIMYVRRIPKQDYFVGVAASKAK